MPTDTVLVAPASQTPASAPTDPKALDPAQVDPAAPPAAEPKKEQIDVSAAMAKLARQEKALFQQKKEFAAQQKEFDDWKKLKGNAKANYKDYLQSGGLTLDDIIQAELGKKPPEPEDRIKTVEEQLEALRKERADEAANAKQRDTDRAVAAFKQQIRGVVDTDPAKYELIAANDAYDRIFEVCELYWNENEHLEGEKRRLPVDQAADLVEAELLERAKKFTSLSKVKSLFQPAPAVEKEIDPKAKDIQAPSPTLTNRAPTPSAGAPKRLLSREESIKQLAAQLDEKWRKKG